MVQGPSSQAGLKRVRSIESNSKRFRRLLINQKESVDETDR
jgi:hypothetical protein